MTKKSAKKSLKNSTVDSAEVNQFDVLSDKWWDESGPMKPLHRLNPVRMKYLKDTICRHYARKDIKGLSIVDVGCGGGLVAEPFARLGAAVTGIDAGKDNIRVAKTHAAAQGLKIDYRATTAEDAADAGEKFDVVTALEIIEHVADVPLFLESCAKLVKKDGILILSTLNRTPKSFLLGIVAAEYVLRWVPQGTHDWKKFLKPSEIAAHLNSCGMKPVDVTGLVYNPLTQEFALSADDLGVNYFMAAVKS